MMHVLQMKCNVCTQNENLGGGGVSREKGRARMELLRGISRDGHGFPWDPTFVSWSYKAKPGQEWNTVKYNQKRLRLSLGSKTLCCLTVTQVDMSWDLAPIILTDWDGKSKSHVE